MNCPFCESENSDNGNYCTICGRTLSGETYLISISDAAKYLGCSNQTVLNLVERGILVRVITGGKASFITRDSMLKFCRVFPEAAELDTKIKVYREEARGRYSEAKLRLASIEGNHVLCDIFDEEVCLSLVTKVAKMRLTAREYEIITKSVVDGIPFAEIGGELGLTRNRVEQIVDKAVRKLKSALRSLQIENSISTQPSKDGKFPIENCGLSTRAHNCMKANNIHDLTQLSGMTVSDFMKLKAIGMKSVNEIKEAMKIRGLHFLDDANDL